MAKIKGNKGGSSKPRSPVEQRDNLQSIAKAKILLALGEGEFAGEFNARNIYLDGTPLENADGSLTYFNGSETKSLIIPYGAWNKVLIKGKGWVIK